MKRRESRDIDVRGVDFEIVLRHLLHTSIEGLEEFNVDLGWFFLFLGDRKRIDFKSSLDL